jgi:hypothetical protein
MQRGNAEGVRQSVSKGKINQSIQSNQIKVMIKKERKGKERSIKQSITQSNPIKSIHPVNSNQLIQSINPITQSLNHSINQPSNARINLSMNE